MTLLLRFPFRWGPSVTTVPVAVVTPLWTKLSPTALGWQVSRAGLMPRFEHIFPEADTGPGWTKVTSVVS